MALSLRGKNGRGDAGGRMTLKLCKATGGEELREKGGREGVGCIGCGEEGGGSPRPGGDWFDIHKKTRGVFQPSDLGKKETGEKRTEKKEKGKKRKKELTEQEEYTTMSLT